MPKWLVVPLLEPAVLLAVLPCWVSVCSHLKKKLQFYKRRKQTEYFQLQPWD